MTGPFCQCSAHPHPCTDPATGGDGLCDHCRAGCLLVGDGSFFVHFSQETDDPEPRMARLREHCSGEVTMYAPAYWTESGAQ